MKLVQEALGRFIVGDDRPLVPPSTVDWVEVDRLARVHSVGPILLRALAQDAVPSELASRWGQARTTYLRNHLRAMRAAVRLFAILEDAGLRAAATRGLVLAQELYPEPGLRPMRDVDVVVEDRDAVAAALAARGIEPVERRRTQLIYVLDGITFEIHWIFLNSKRYMGTVTSTSLIDSRRPLPTPEGLIFRIDDTEEMLALITHVFIHHELDKLHPLVDIGLYLRRTEIDWTALRTLCRQHNLTRMVALSCAFADWLLETGLPLPIDVPMRHRLRTFEAFRAQLFGGDRLAHHARRKAALLWVAERPGLKARQLLRFLARDELRQLLHIASGFGTALRHTGYERRIRPPRASGRADG